jgi:hypothetical protein
LTELVVQMLGKPLFFTLFDPTKLAGEPFERRRKFRGPAWRLIRSPGTSI